jgi:hypothetical protein
MKDAIQKFSYKGACMTFKMEVGMAEKHVVEFKFNQLAGSLLIQVDNKPVVQSKRVFNEPICEVYDFTVGGRVEKSQVRIEKQRKQLFGCRSRVYVDNRLARVFDGM